MKIGIINYSLGNVGSVSSAFKYLGHDVKLISNEGELKYIDIIVLAGVGNFKTAVAKLGTTELWDEINNEVLINKKPVLGICLGMQLFADMSHENGENEGFGWIKGKVEKMNGSSFRIPHMGWNKVKSLDRDLFEKMKYDYFYFMHSYHLIPEDKSLVIGTTRCGNMDIVSAVRKDNIIGVQFHPEKSQADGLRFLNNFMGVAC